MASNRHRIFLLSFCVLSSVPVVAWAQPTLIERSLKALGEAPPSSPDCFDFIVVGDSNTLKSLEQSEVFRQSIREFNILKPDFVLEVGDIVLGGAAEGVPAQWDLFDEVIADCEPPFLPLPGNHDISDAATEEIWRNRIGTTHYAFHYGNSLFVLLNSEELDAVYRISDEQSAWLREQLESTTAKNIFIFLHKPYFANEGDPETAPECWEKHWEKTASTFLGHPVRAVFAGHWHTYRDCGVREGVRYVICGGASVYGMHFTEEEGSFNHYLWVRVRGESVSWAVIKPGSILPEDAVTSARIDELYNVRNRWVHASEILVPLGEPVSHHVTITIHNPLDTPMCASASWETTPDWTVTPAKTNYEVGGKSAVNLAFDVRAVSPEKARFPVPIFHTRYTQTQHGPPVDLAQDLKFVPVLAAARAEAGIVIDGELDEWSAAQMAPLHYPVHFDAKDTDDLTCKLGFLWDDTHLFMAVETQDNEFHQPFAGDIVWSADNVECFLGDWSWGLSLTEKGPEVFMYGGVGLPAETVNTNVILAVKRHGARVTYEAAFPKALVAPLELVPGGHFRFNAAMNDLDPSGPLEERHWLELIPGAGSTGRKAPRMEVLLAR